MSVKISFNHSTNLFTLYTEFGSIQFGGYSELVNLMETKKSLSFLKDYSLNRSFLRNVARKHHRNKLKGAGDGRSSRRVFIVPLKSELTNKCYSYKEKYGQVDRSVTYAEDIACSKHNMDVAVRKAKEYHDLAFFKDFFDAYKDYIYYSTGRTYVSKKMEADAYKRFLNLLN